MIDRQGFGASLKAERERRGITLDAVALRTKVTANVFADMERGCLDRWPPGIFARAFIRGYAEAVGLDERRVLADFVRLFPDAEVPRRERVPAVGGEATSTGSEDDRAVVDAAVSPLRLTFDAGDGVSRGSAIRGPAARRLAWAAADAGLAAGLAGLVGMFLGAPAFWTAFAALAVGGHLVGSTRGGDGAVAAMLVHGRGRPATRGVPITVLDSIPDEPLPLEIGLETSERPGATRHPADVLAQAPPRRPAEQGSIAPVRRPPRRHQQRHRRSL
jgi:hypothetical protein